jgi:hypothetical protein
MSFRVAFLTIGGLLLSLTILKAQSADSLQDLTGIVYDESFSPLAATHVINLSTRQGDVSDTLGIFHLRVRLTDTLLIRNIAFKDTRVAAGTVARDRFVILQRIYYPLQEAKIFNWGSTYEDFREAVIEMPTPETLGESLGLPQQDPDYVPLEMNEKEVRSAGLLLTSPLTYFYQNFNKYAKSARKVYWLEKNQKKQEAFDYLVSSENLKSVTGLTGDKLLEFRSFLLENMVCTLSCTELAVYEEIYGLWAVFMEMEARGMLDSQ